MLIDKHIPNFQFSEIHYVNINTNAEKVYHSTMALNLSKSKVIEIFFKLRDLPFHDKGLSQINKDMKFTLLEEIPY